MIAEIDEQDPLADPSAARGRDRRRRPRGIDSRPAMNAAPTSTTTPATQASRAGESTNHESQPDDPGRRFGSSRAHTVRSKCWRQLGTGQRRFVDHREHALQPAVAVVAGGAGRQVRRRPALVGVGHLAVVVQHEIVFGQVRVSITTLWPG